MLRRLVGETEHEDAQIGHIIDLINRYRLKLRDHYPDDVKEYEYVYRIENWAGGFKDSLNELEQSRYMAYWYRKRVSKQFEEEMDEQELADYQCHIYFYKNTFIRVFSTLDKLGYFMNELFLLHTERVKPRFSYFTVLRQMKLAPELEKLYQQLQKIKIEYQEPLNTLRNRRNMEIHYINIEMLDDLQKTTKRFATRSYIENLDHNMLILEQGCQMVLGTMEAVFLFCSERLPKPRTSRRT